MMRVKCCFFWRGKEKKKLYYVPDRVLYSTEIDIVNRTRHTAIPLCAPRNPNIRGGGMNDLCCIVADDHFPGEFPFL